VKLSDPDIGMDDLVQVIKRDGSIAHRVLRALNAAGSPLRVEITSIPQAIVLLGRDTIRRWASLWVVASMNESAHPELLTASMIRARCCELLESASGGDPGAGFLLGMCSQLDAILEQPMQTVLAHLPVAADIRAALVGEQNRRRALLDAIIAFERGEWDRAAAHALEARVDVTVLPGAYQNALRWARGFQSVA
jgi:EAL and modified HD-GYP domain-containing signal transduction protein